MSRIGVAVKKPVVEVPSVTPNRIGVSRLRVNNPGEFVEAPQNGYRPFSPDLATVTVSYPALPGRV